MSGQAPFTPPGPIDVTYTSKTTPHDHVILVAPRPHGWRIPEVINPSLRSVVPTQDKNVYTYYEQLMALRRACEALGLELVEMSEDLTPPFTEEDANKVLMISADGKTKIWKTSTATGIDATVEQLPDGAKITIVNSGVLSEATVYNGEKGERGSDGFTPTVDIQQLPNGITITVTDAEGTKTATITNGEKGDPGFSPSARVERVDGGAVVTVTDETGTTTAMINDGTNGTSGRDGLDGISPTATVTQTSPNTVSFTVTDANGTTVATLSGEAGQDGADGVDGVSPIARVVQEPYGASVSITDANGTTTAQILNGQDGSNGTDGRDGVDGVSPTATVSQQPNGALVSITDKNGTTTAMLNNGQDGSAGADGYSPSAHVTQTANGAEISITDKTGTTTATVANGAKGDAGVGIPTGGTDGQILVKDGNTDYAMKWVDREQGEQKEYSMSYNKRNGKWYTDLSDGTTVQSEQVPDEWTQGGAGGAIITEEATVGDRTCVLVQHDTERENGEYELITYKEGIGVEDDGNVYGPSGYVTIIKKGWYPWEGGYPLEQKFMVPTGVLKQMTSISADTDIPANGRVMVQVPITTDQKIQIEAVNSIMFQDADTNPAGRNDCVIQSYGTTNGRKTVQVAVRNISGTAARIKVSVATTVRQIYN